MSELQGRVCERERDRARKIDTVKARKRLQAETKANPQKPSNIKEIDHIIQNSKNMYSETCWTWGDSQGVGGISDGHFKGFFTVEGWREKGAWVYLRYS